MRASASGGLKDAATLCPHLCGEMPKLSLTDRLATLFSCCVETPPYTPQTWPRRFAFAATLHEPSKMLSFGRIGKSLQVRHTSGGAVLTYWLSTSLMDQRHTSTLRQILAILRELQPNRPPQLCRTACLTPARSTIIPACGFHWLYNLLRCVVRVVQG